MHTRCRLFSLKSSKKRLAAGLCSSRLHSHEIGGKEKKHKELARTRNGGRIKRTKSIAGVGGRRRKKIGKGEGGKGEGKDLHPNPIPRSVLEQNDWQTNTIFNQTVLSAGNIPPCYLLITSCQVPSCVAHNCMIVGVWTSNG